MAKQYANIQPGFDTFAAWVTKTNNLLDDMTNIVVTIAANSTGGITTGNAYINGTLSSPTGAFNTIRGGNVSTNAALTIASNVSIANSYALTFGNATVNSSISATALVVGSNVATFGNTLYSVANGNVGIGTTQPTFRFVAANNSNDGMWGDSAATLSTMGLGGYSSGAGGAFQIKYERSTGTTTFNCGSRDTFTPSMHISAAGQVGIGNTTPTNVLSVQGNTYISGGIVANGSIGSNGQVLTSNGTGMAWANATGGGANGVTTFNTRTGAVSLTAADITGNSTIGLNYTPVSSNTSGTINGSLTLTSGDLTLRDVISSRDIRAGNSTVNSTINATALVVASNVATFGNAVYIVANGNVGIGTASPRGLFHVTAAANDSFLIRGHLQLANGISLYSATANNDNVKAMEFAASSFYFNTGYVGIGNTTPTNILSVQGNTYISGGIIANGSIGSNGQVLSSNGTGLYWASSS